MSQQAKASILSDIKKVFWITFWWTLLSVFQFFSGWAILLNFGCDLSNIDAMLQLRGSVLTGILAGLLGGSVVVFVWERWLRVMNYGLAIVSILLTFTLVYLLVAIPTDIFMQSKILGLPLPDRAVIHKAFNLSFEVEELSSFIYWFSVVVATLIILQVMDKYGPGVFAAFLLGRYFRPKREERIFMFLDLRSSTKIAESIGEFRYFNFLKDVFRHSTPAILESKGEIYQYVGDEIVISWKTNIGIEQSNCIRCFLEIQEALAAKRNYYESMYDGNLPVFKAGLHYGYVMAGEIGVIKRDIAYSGDVLNTTARIQSMCNELKVDILLSKFLVDKLAPAANIFSPKEIGSISLRGKKEAVVLYTI